MSRRPLLALIALAALAMACRLPGRSGQSPPTPGVVRPAEIPPSLALRDPIELSAVAAGNTVRFQITNNAVEGLYVGPENFALISPGVDEPLLATSEQVLARFRPTVVGLHEGLAGEIIFLGLQDVVGHRLVFNSAQVDPHLWRADIALAPPE